MSRVVAWVLSLAIASSLVAGFLIATGTCDPTSGPILDSLVASREVEAGPDLISMRGLA